MELLNKTKLNKLPFTSYAELCLKVWRCF